MSSISGIGNSYYDHYTGSYSRDAAGMSMANKTETQIRGYDTAQENLSAGQSVLNISDGALSGINDYLQSIREIAVKASNTALYSKDDIASMQNQIDQYKQGISDIASSTSYNEQRLLNGENTDFRLATDANGSSMNISTGDATLKALGIADFDITKKNDLSAIDQAMKQVGEIRGTGGAQSNAIDHAQNFSALAAYNQTASYRYGDVNTFVRDTASEQQQKNILETYRLMMQKQQQEQNANRFSAVFMQ